jgi:magnesium-transporting ATPase (P-type)
MKRISCTNLEGILVAGKVNVAFFDKTGTLTKTGMDLISSTVNGDAARLSLGMAVCHTLTTTNTGEIGNQVDKASFESSGAVLKQKKGKYAEIVHGEKTYSVLKRFEFDSHRVTQSVLIEDEVGGRQVFVKQSGGH